MLEKLRGLLSRLPKWGTKRLWLWAYGVIPTLILAGAVEFWREDPPVLQDFHRQVFDGFNRRWPRRYDPAAPVVIVDIDDESLAKLGQWPWPRTWLAALLQRLSSMGAKAVAFDIVFSEPDRTSPPELARAKSLAGDPALAGLVAKLKTLPDHDELFGRVIAQEGMVVMGFSFTENDNELRPATPARILTRSRLREGAGAQDWTPAELEERKRRDPNFKVELDIREPQDFLPDHYWGAVRNIPALEDRAAGNGSFNAQPDRDNVIRRLALVHELKGKLYPSLVAEALRVYHGGRGLVVTVSGAARTLDLGAANGIHGVGVLKSAKEVLADIPTDRHGDVLFYGTGHRRERFVPAWEILQKEDFDPARISGKIVFVGTSAEGLKDQRATPMDAAAPGVEVHAEIAEQVLLGDFLLRPDWGELLEVVFIIVVGLALIVLMSRLGAAWCALIAGGGVAGAVWASRYAYVHRNLLVDPVFPSFVIVAIYLAASLINYLRSESEKRQVRGAFSRYMSPALVEQLANDPSRLKLGGEMREMTLLFSDIRGFTTISEQFDAHGLTSFINRYLTPMTETVIERKGTIDKYMGDCIMAFWNAPLDDAGHVKNACDSALEMNRRLNELNVQWEKEAVSQGRKFIPIRAGIGLNTGLCCVGNMGSDMRFDYSVLGDEVNLASRLEGQSKNYGVDIVIGAQTREKAAGYAALELDLIKVKGKTVPVHIYTLLGGPEFAAGEPFLTLSARHAEMIVAYRNQKWGEAERLMAECEALHPALHKYYEMVRGRIAAYRLEPPGAAWDGVFTATSK